MARMSADPASNLRLRSKNSYTSQSPFALVDTDMKKGSKWRMGERVYLLVLAFYLLLLTLVFHADSYLPSPKRTDRVAVNGSEEFIEERSRAHLIALSSIGPRIAGSYENEVLAVEFLLAQINAIKDRCGKQFNFHVDVQKPTGSFNLKFQDGFTSHYSKVKNILVKLEPKQGAQHSLLVNCHYDTAPGSPGASDDAVNCAIMLEVLNVLAQSKSLLKHSIVFSFNGAEENVLQAAHGFITQHPWAKLIRAFINLEACGSGGREIVFQAGPENPWLVQAYAKQVPRPFASVLGQEIFASGIIPGDTDYRIYRDYGHIPGLDFAYIDNGYIYHTKFDRSEYIPPGTVQRAGENILALVRHLASSPLLADPGSQRKGNIIFFDMLGFYLVTYSEMCGTILNLVTAALATFALHNAMRSCEETGLNSSIYMLNLFAAGIVVLISWFCVFIAVICLASILDCFGATMSWFNCRYWVLFLYTTCSLAVLVMVHRIGSNLQKKYLLVYVKDSGWFLESLYFEATRLIWVIALVTLTVFQCRSSFLFMSWILFPTVIRSFFSRSIFRRRPTPVQFLAMYLSSQTVSCLVIMYAAFVVHYIFLPIMGRAGAIHNPDIFVGALMAFCTIVVTSFMMSLVHLTSSIKRLLSALLITLLFSMVAVCFTPLGFPYSGDSSKPTPQRYIVIHTHRTFHNIFGDVRREDSGFWVLPMDYNGPRQVVKFMPELKNAAFVPDDCEHELYCGMPYYFPVLTKLSTSFYLQAIQPKIHSQSKLEMVSQKAVRLDTRRLTFNLTGPTHMSVILSPSIYTQLVNWSFADGVPDSGPYWGNRKTYFIYYSRAESPAQWSFWIDLKLSPRQTQGDVMLDVAMTTHNLHGPDETTIELKRFIKRFPSWTVPVSWTGTYQAWAYTS